MAASNNASLGAISKEAKSFGDPIPAWIDYPKPNDRVYTTNLTDCVGFAFIVRDKKNTIKKIAMIHSNSAHTKKYNSQYFKLNSVTDAHLISVINAGDDHSNIYNFDIKVALLLRHFLSSNYYIEVIIRLGYNNAAIDPKYGNEIIEVHSQTLENMLAEQGFSRKNKNLAIKYIATNGLYLGVDGNGHVHLTALNNPFLGHALKKQIVDYQRKLTESPSFLRFFSNNDIKERFLMDLLKKDKFPHEIFMTMSQHERCVILADITLLAIVKQYKQSHALIHRTLNPPEIQTLAIA